MGFHLLPDSLHKRIFAVFPLQHRLQLRQVSPHWKHLIEGMCTELTSLKVFGCKADVREYCSRLREVHWEEAQGMALKCPAPDSAIDDDLVIAFHHFEAACTLLPRLFPELRHIVCFFHLQLYRYEAPDGPVFSGSVKGYFRHVPLLLAAYRNTLTALTIGGRMTTIQSDRNERNTPQLVVDEINQMTALERLDLQVENHFSSATTNYHLTRSIGRVLPHLKHFSLSDSCHGMNVFRPDFSDAIAALGPECTHISLDLLDYHPELVEAFKSHPDLPSTLTHLHLSGQIAMYQVFLNCLEDFTSLQYLYVKTITTRSSFFPLMGSHANVFSELRFGSWNCNICEFTLSPDVHLALCSVKKLTIDHLSLSSNQSDDVRKFSFRLSQWFPHLQELHIVSYQPNVARQIEFFLNYFTNLRAHQIVTTAKPAILSGRFYRPPVPVPLYEIIDFPAQFQRRGDRGVRGGGFAGGLRFPAVLNPAWYRVEEEVNEAGNAANVDNLVGANLDGDGANQIGDIEEAEERGEFAIEEAPLALDEMLIREVPAAEVHQREEIVGGGLQALRRPLLVHIRRRNGGDLVGNGQEDEDEEVDLVDLDDDEEEDDEDDEEEMRMGREVVDLPPWHEDSREEMEDDYCDWVNDVEISSDEDFGS